MVLGAGALWLTLTRGTDVIAATRDEIAGLGAAGVLPDSFVGAHAAVLGLRLLTREARRYRTYLPTVELIAPEP